MEMFDEMVESRFAAVQVLDAAYLSFCHGANDIANVAGMHAGYWPNDCRGSIWLTRPRSAGHWQPCSDIRILANQLRSVPSRTNGDHLADLWDGSDL